MRTHHYLVVACSWGAVILLLIGLKACQNKRDEAIANQTLSPKATEKIIINPLKRTLTVITEKGSKSTTLPDRPSSIEIFKSGKVKVTAPQYGFEAVPFIGIGWSRQLNDYIGCDVYYWKKLDLGAAVTFDRDLSFQNTSLAASLSYTVWNNSRLSIMVDTAGRPHVAVTVRL